MRRRPDSSKTIRRQWAVGMLLQKEPWTVARLAKAFKVSKATMQRDIDLLRSLFKVSVKRDKRHSQRVLYQMRGRFVSIV